MLPPVDYYYEIKEIADEFGLNPKNSQDIDWLRNFIFFNKTIYPRPLYIQKLMRNEKTGEWELWVRFFWYTKLSDIKARDLRDYKKHLIDYKGKNKSESGYVERRNEEVTNTYLQEIRKRGLRIRNPHGHSIALITLKKHNKNYPELTKNLIKKIVRKSLE